MSSHGLVSHFLWVLLGGTSFLAVLLHVGCSIRHRLAQNRGDSSPDRASLSRSRELCSTTLEMSLKQWDIETVRWIVQWEALTAACERGCYHSLGPWGLGKLLPPQAAALSHHILA